MSCFRRWRVLVLASLMLISGKRVSPPQTQQDPFQIATFCTPVPAGQRQVTVTTGDDLQRALDQAVAGDTILLADGATFRPAAPDGSFLLRNRRIPAGQWVTIRSANRAFDANGALPPSTRVDKANANLMPKLRAIGNQQTCDTRRSRRARLSADRPRHRRRRRRRAAEQSRGARLRQATRRSTPSRPTSSSIAATCTATTRATTGAASR